jgi:hypothetical protein
MPASQIVIEEESGTYTGRRRHPHNGYYAGDFWSDWPTRNTGHLAGASAATSGHARQR